MFNTVHRSFLFSVLSWSCLPPNKSFVFCSLASYFQESRSLIPADDKGKVHYVLAVTRHIENFVQWVTASGPLVMQPTNLSVVPLVMGDWCEFSHATRFYIRKKHRLVLYFINLSTNSSTLRPLWYGACCTEWQPIHSLIRMDANTCQIDRYPAFVVDLCLIYKLEKLTDQQFQAKILPSSPSGNSELKPPFHLEFQTAHPSPPNAFRIPVQQTFLPPPLRIPRCCPWWGTLYSVYMIWNHSMGTWWLPLTCTNMNT